MSVMLTGGKVLLGTGGKVATNSACCCACNCPGGGSYTVTSLSIDPCFNTYTGNGTLNWTGSGWSGVIPTVLGGSTINVSLTLTCTSGANCNWYLTGEVVGDPTTCFDLTGDWYPSSPILVVTGSSPVGTITVAFPDQSGNALPDVNLIIHLT